MSLTTTCDSPATWPSSNPELPPDLNLKIHRIIAQHFYGVDPHDQAEPDRTILDLAFQRDVERLHQLGPRPQCELLREIGNRYGCAAFIEERLNLEPADFEVKIGGERVRVESVQWIGAEGPGSDPIPSTALAGVLEPEVRGRLIVVVVQKSLEPIRAIGLLRLLQDSGRLLARLTPDDRVAILSFDSHLKIWLDFTGDLDRVRTVLAEEVMFRKPVPIAPGRGLSLVSRLSQEVGRATYTIEDALRLLGQALEPLPGSKSVVLIGYGFGQLTVTLGMVGPNCHNVLVHHVSGL